MEKTKRCAQEPTDDLHKLHLKGLISGETENECTMYLYTNTD